MLKRWLRFNLVGLIGIAVQLATLAVLTRSGVGYLMATGLAVEATVVHNFLWHEHYTWRDRALCGVCRRLTRLFKFNVANGAVSLGGNLLLMHLLVGVLHLPVLVANLVAIATCSAINFLLGEAVVFRPEQPSSGS